jgi:hypothetical protein
MGIEAESTDYLTVDDGQDELTIGRHNGGEGFTFTVTGEAVFFAAESREFRAIVAFLTNTDD